MCCLFAILALFGPRLAIFIWWLADMGRWQRAFDAIWWPVLGFLFLPWTTIAYVLVFSNGIHGLEWIWLVLGLIFDISSYSGSGYGNRDRLRR